ncbi:MAG: 50S ribosomal protein L29 [Bryobacterales bacterium]|jgi:large subunit ribosomal protein L29|nr:50S ribosomal protein L29 [Bryobacterales bacterium]MDE0296206.1 50S ribosomal protein L29 [Bryobacterales bacterium]MDE0436549.1 50S ribosomal protein L29 [Bryobacterales bacterium]
MRAEEIRELDLEELAAKENEMREQMFRLRFQLGMGQTDGLKKYRALRKDLARLLTVRQEKALAAEQGT